MQTRITKQKTKILTYLKATHAHPSAEEVYQEIRKELPSITLATVYRNLNQLAQEGTILRLKVGNTYHYDGQQGTHAHGICEQCKQVFDIHQTAQTQKKLLHITHDQFTPKTVKTIYTGTCKHCA